MKCIRCNFLVHFDSELLIAIYTHSAGRLYTFSMEDFSQLLRDFLNCLEEILSYHAPARLSFYQGYRSWTDATKIVYGLEASRVSLLVNQPYGHERYEVDV